MIVYGHYYKTLKKLPISNEVCPNCEVKGQMFIETICKVNHALFIPYWASDKEVIISCNVCGKRYLNSGFPHLQSQIKDTYIKSRYRWYYFIGTILFFALISFFITLMILGNRENEKNMLESIDSVYAGQTIFYKLDDGNKTCMYVDSIIGDTLIVRENTLSVNRDMYQIDEPENYSKKQTFYTKSQLKEMMDEDKLIEIALTTTAFYYHKNLFEK